MTENSNSQSENTLRAFQSQELIHIQSTFVGLRWPDLFHEISSDSSPDVSLFHNESDEVLRQLDENN